MSFNAYHKIDIWPILIESECNGPPPPLDLTETQLAVWYAVKTPLKPQFPPRKVLLQPSHGRSHKVSSPAFDYRRRSITAQYLCSQFVLY